MTRTGGSAAGTAALCQASKGSRARRGNPGLGPFGAAYAAPFPVKGSALFVGYPPLRTPAAALCDACGRRQAYRHGGSRKTPAVAFARGLDLALGVPGSSWSWWPLEVGCLCHPERVWLMQGVPVPHGCSARPWSSSGKHCKAGFWFWNCNEVPWPRVHAGSMLLEAFICLGQLQPNAAVLRSPRAFVPSQIP